MLGGSAVHFSLAASFFTDVRVVGPVGDDFGDEELWARWIALFREQWPLAGDGPSVVFSSDPYAAELARRLGAAYVVVDADRVAVPISATRVREQPADHLDFLAAPVRSWVETTWLTR